MKATKEAVVIARHINGFLNEYMPSQKTKSEHTIISYENAFSLYLAFLETEKSVNTENLCANCFSVENIEGWLVWLREKRGNSAKTCNVRLASIRVFVRYLGKQDVRFLYLSQEASQIERRKTVKTKVSGMSKQATQALLASPNCVSKVGRRDIALMVTMYSTAARMSEILTLKIEHLHLNAKKPFVTVIGKRDKIRTLYLLPMAVSHLQAYLDEAHGDNPLPNSYVFYSRIKGLGEQMSQSAVNKQLKKHARSARAICDEVPRNIHAHQLRHAKASHWLEDGMNIVQISTLLGHEKLETTMGYLNITTEQQAEALATLEDEKTKSMPKKWKTSGKSLAEMCGVRKLKS